MAARRFDESTTTPARVSPELFDRLPPQSLDAEKAVLGSLLLDPLLCDEVSLVLRAEDFYSDANQKLFTHLVDMHSAGRRIDNTLLVERLKKQGDYELVGGIAYLAEIIDSVQVAAHAVHYAEIVRQKAISRKLIHAGTEIVRDAFDQSLESRDLLNKAEEKIFSILDQRAAGELVNIHDVLQEAMDRIDARMDREHELRGVPTGFDDFDDMSGGLHDSELIILAARPSMGKTALATNIAEYVALQARIPVLFVSLEMSRLELGERMLASYAKVDGHKLRTGRLTTGEQAELVDKSAELSRAPLFIDDTPSRTMTEIAASARRLKRKHGLGLIVIDYLQLIDPENPRDPRQEQVARIARRLKGLARELKLPVLCLGQLNRQADATKDNRPRLSHLRESGAIEQDADVVLFVHREEYYMTKEEAEDQKLQGKALLIIAKQRNGPTGDVDMWWRAAFTRFESAPQEEYLRNGH